MSLDEPMPDPAMAVLFFGVPKAFNLLMFERPSNGRNDRSWDIPGSIANAFESALLLSCEQEQEQEQEQRRA